MIEEHQNFRTGLGQLCRGLGRSINAFFLAVREQKKRFFSLTRGRRQCNGDNELLDE
jgi:hypothetical protein